MCRRLPVLMAAFVGVFLSGPAAADFVNVTRQATFYPTDRMSSASPSWADFNNDGLVDLGVGYHPMRNNGPDPTGQCSR